jgi:hypothetical protein
MRDPPEMNQKVSGTIYHWADEVINAQDEETGLKEITNVFSLAINIINNLQQ